MADQIDSQASPTSTVVVRPLRKACDECHAIKVKCLPLSDQCEGSSSTGSICQRCHRLNFECRFSPADIKSRRRKRRKVAEPAECDDDHSDGDADPSQANFAHQVCTAQQSTQSQPTLNQISQTYPPSCPPFPLAFPTPPLISDFSSIEWEGWFRDLPMGAATTTSPSGQGNPRPQMARPSLARTTSPSTLIPQAGSGSQTSLPTDLFSGTAATSPWAPATPGLAAHTQLPARTSVSRDSDQEAMLRAIFGADPCFSFPTSGCSAMPEQNQRAMSSRDTQTPNDRAMSLAGETSESTHPVSFPYDSGETTKRNASPSSARTNAHLSIEARLSHLSLEFSAALDRCDPSRTTINSTGGDNGDAEASQNEKSKAESHLLSLFAQADEVWCEMDTVGADRMKKMYDVIETLREGEGEAESRQPNEKSVSSSSSLAVRYSKSLQGPFTSAGAMLALSLSFQMLDALRLLSSILDSVTAPASFDASASASASCSPSHSTLSTILTSFQFNAKPLIPTLHVPVLASLRNHYLHRLIDKLGNVITYARTWHHLGEGMGPGPHDSCAVQIQGAKVKGDLLELSKRVG